MSSFSRSLIFTFFALLISTTVFAQPKTNSPYSRFGLGDLLDQRFAVLQTTGFTNAYHDYYHLNFQNPASFGHLTVAAFDIGLYAQRSTWEDGNNSNENWSGNLSYLSIGFPMLNPVNQVLDREIKPLKWGMGFNLQPYSLIGYDLQTVSDPEDIGQIITRLQGTGGTYQLQWANGVKYKQFSGGINIGYLFGRLENAQVISLNELTSSYENRFNDNINIKGFTWNLGAQYDILIKTEDPRYQKSVTIGVTGHSGHEVKTKTSQFFERFNRTYIFPQDTILSTSNIRGNATLPAAFGAGVIYTQNNKLQVGVNFDFSAWSDYENDANPEELSNSWRVSFGGEYIPNYASYNSFLKRVRYRAGTFYGRDPRSIDGEQINQIGATIGFGLPLSLARQQVSFVNLSFEIGKNGANTDIKETYGRMIVGFTLNDNSWFFKRRFN